MIWVTFLLPSKMLFQLFCANAKETQGDFARLSVTKTKAGKKISRFSFVIDSVRVTQPAYSLLKLLWCKCGNWLQYEKTDSGRNADLLRGEDHVVHAQATTAGHTYEKKSKSQSFSLAFAFVTQQREILILGSFLYVL